MEIILIIAVLAGLVWWFFFRKPEQPTTISTPVVEKEEVAPVLEQQPVSWHTAPPEGSKLAENVLDVNHDGKVNLEDVKEVVKKTRTRVKKAVDKDGDGKVTVKDAKAAVKKVTRGRKPKSQKA